MAITGPSRQRPLRHRSSGPYQNHSRGQSSQVLPNKDQTATAQEAVVSPTVGDDTKEQIISEAKCLFRYQFFTKFPFPSQESVNDLSRTSLHDAMNMILGGNNSCSTYC